MTNAPNPKISDFVSDWSASDFGHLTEIPWVATDRAEALVQQALRALGPDFRIEESVAVHRTAIIERGAIVKGPAIIGEGAFIASNAYLRGGVFIDRACIVGPCCEIKTTFMLDGAKVAHLSFVGDTIIGARANIEAGAIIANYRNELTDKTIRILTDAGIVETGMDKFGSLIGDDARIGANAVIAPGALIQAKQLVPRLSLIDQHPDAN